MHRDNNKRERSPEAPSLKTETPSIPFALFPTDLLHCIYRENLPPTHWACAAGVCKHWNTVFKHPNLWPSSGWNFLLPHVENGQKALEVVNCLFAKAPDRLKCAFQPTFPLKTLPCQNFNTQPTTESLKNFFLYQFLKDNGQEEPSLQYLAKATEGGHPKAIWKFVNKDVGFQFIPANPSQEDLDKVKPREILTFCKNGKLYCKHFHEEQMEIVKSDCIVPSFNSEMYDSVLKILQGSSDLIQLQKDLKQAKRPQSQILHLYPQFIDMGQVLADYVFSRYISPRENTRCLHAALGGEPKAQARIFNVILTYLDWKRSLMVYQHYDIQSYIKDTKVAAVNEKFTSLFQECVKLAELWPGGRDHLLRCAIPTEKPTNPIPDTLISQFEKIGNGEPAELFFGSYNGKVPLHVKWPEAFFILGKHFLERTKAGVHPSESYNAAFHYLSKAYPVGAEESAHLLANAVLPNLKSIPFLQYIQTKFPTPSGTVFTKLALIKISEIPKNAPENDPQVQEFLHFVKDAHQQLLMKKRYSPFLMSQPFFGKQTKDAAVRKPMKVTKASHFIDTLGNSLNEKDSKEFLGIKLLFLDWLMTITNYSIYISLPWFKEIAKEYICKTWGEDFLKTGKLKKACYKHWTTKDTICALESFKLHYKQQQKNLFKTLATIELQNKNKKEFIRFFGKYCDSLSNDTIAKYHCEFLSNSLTTFLTQSPENAELPLLFGKLLRDSEFWTRSTIRAEWQPKATEYLKIAAKNGSKDAQDLLAPLAPQQYHNLVNTEEPMPKKRKTFHKKEKDPMERGS